MVKIETKDLDKYLDVDVVENNGNLSELISVIAVAIKYTMNKHNMTHNDVMNQVEMFVKGTKLGVVEDGNTISN